MRNTYIFKNEVSGFYHARRWWDNGQGVTSLQGEKISSFIEVLKNESPHFSDDYFFINEKPDLSSSELGGGLDPDKLSSLDNNDYDKVVSALSGF